MRIRLASAVTLAFVFFFENGLAALPGIGPLSVDEVEARKERGQSGPKHLGDGVVELDDSSIEEFISTNPTVLVLFYAFWCHWCKDLIPRYREASRLLKAKGSFVTLAQLDASRNLIAADKYDVRAYPTVTLFLDGIPHEYEGGRTSREIVSWVEQHVETESFIHEVPQLNALIEASRNEPLLLGHFTNAEYHAVFHAVTRHIDHVHFGSVIDEALVDELVSRKLAPSQIDRSNFVLLINPHYYKSPTTEAASYLFTEELSSEKALIEFARRYTFPAVVEFTYETAPLLLQDGRDILILFTEGNPADKEEKILASTAEYIRGTILFAVARQDPGAKRLMFALGMNAADEEFPTIRILRNPTDASKRQKFRMPEDTELTEESLRKFISHVLAGEAKPWVKSEGVPDEPAADGEVQTLVASEWQNRVIDTERNVLIKIYAPWCGHCKMLEPAYNEVARILAGVPSVDVMRIDATQNEIALPISGYPTLVLFTGPLDERRHHYYSGGPRTAEAIVDWVATSVPFDLKQQNAVHAAGGGAGVAVGADEL